MAERTEKLILVTEERFEFVGQENLDKLISSTNLLTKSNLEKVAADKKVEQAANQINKVVETQTQKNSALASSIEKTGKAMQQIASTNALKESFNGTANQVDLVNAALKKFQEASRAAKSVDELTAALNELTAALPEDVATEALKMVEKETAKLADSIDKPVARLRELKRLINTTDDPELLKQYQIEAGKLQDKLGDTNELVRALASDTFFTDTLVEGAQQAVGAFSAFQGILALTADDQEEFAKAAAKAQGALALLQGTQQIITNLKKEDNIITRLQIVSQKAYGFVVGETTGALKGFRLALAATGIGIAVIALGYLVANFDKVKYALGFGVNPETERYIELTKKAVEAAQKEIEAFESQAATLRVLADRRKEANDDIVRGELDRANEEINILNREQEKRKALGEAQVANIQAEVDKLLELQVKRDDIARILQSGIDAPGVNFAALEREKAVADERVSVQAKLVSDLEEENNKLFVQDQEAVLKIDVINKQKTDILKKNLDKQNDDRLKSLAEQERHALAVAGIEKKSEQEILNIKIDFAQKRLAITRQIGTADRVEIEKLKNTISELRLELENIKPVDFSSGLVQAIAPGSLAALEKQAALLRDTLNIIEPGELSDELSAELTKAEKEIEETRKRLFPQQQEINNEFLDEEERHQLALLNIDEASAIDRINVQIAFAKERLEILREQGKAETDEAQRIENQIVELTAEAEKEKQRLREQDITTRLENVKSILTIASDLSNQLLNIEIKRYDDLTRLQQQRVKDAEEIAETGNVALLEQEQKRLDEITKKREKFVRRQQVLAQLELIANTVVAVSKAAAEGGGIASAFTISAALAALAIGLSAGISQARSTDLGTFKKGGIFDPNKGGYTGYGPTDGVSLALGKKPYEYHFREHIMPASVAGIGDNLKWLEKIRMDRIDIGKMMNRKETIVVAGNDNKEIAEAIKQRPSFIFNMNSRGIINIHETNEWNKKRLKSKR